MNTCRFFNNDKVSFSAKHSEQQLLCSTCGFEFHAFLFSSVLFSLHAVTLLEVSQLNT